MKIAVVGATGKVGQVFLQLLEERKFPVDKIKLFASAKSAGRKLNFRGREIPVQALGEDNFNNLNIVFFSAGGEISRQWAQEAVRAGATVIDNSSAFRMEKDIPLIVPEVNAHCLTTGAGIIANPNCSTIQLVLALHPLNTRFELQSVDVSTYQSLSGAGQKAIKTLKEESQNILNRKSLLALPAGSKAPAFNCIPQIGAIDKDGFSTEEAKLMRETKKILSLPDLKITATAVRVPTFNGHGEAVTLTLRQPAIKQDLISCMEKQKGLTVLEGDHLPHQRFVDGRDDVYVGRIRSVPRASTDDTGSEEKATSWMMWVAADNLRKGAALNGLQIAETLIKA